MLKFINYNKKNSFNNLETILNKRRLTQNSQNPIVKKIISNVLKYKFADLVAVSRRFINEPYWLLKKDSRPLKLNKKSIPNQYLRCF